MCVCVHSNNNNNISNIIINQTFFFFHGCDLGGRRRLDRRILSCHSASFDSARVLLLSRCAVDYFQFFAFPPGSPRSPRARTWLRGGPFLCCPHQQAKAMRDLYNYIINIYFNYSPCISITVAIVSALPPLALLSNFVPTYRTLFS